MTVYVLSYFLDYEGSEILGVYTSRKDAQDHAPIPARHRQTWITQAQGVTVWHHANQGWGCAVQSFVVQSSRPTGKTRRSTTASI